MMLLLSVHVELLLKLLSVGSYCSIESLLEYYTY